MSLEQVDIGGQEADISPEVVPEVTPEITANPAEEKARADGWKSEEEWGDSKDKPAEFVSAEIFNERGKWIEKQKAQQKRVDDLEKSFNSRLDNQREFMKQQAEAQKNELIRKRDEAIDDADRKTANKYQDDIDSLKKVDDEPAVSNNQQDVLDNWNKTNTWILQNNPKAAYGKQQFGAYQQQGMTATQAIAAMEADVSREFPDVNPLRHNAPLQEGGTPPGGKPKPRKLTMGDLTSDEKKYYNSMPGAWKNDAEFLQTVQDVRGEL